MKFLKKINTDRKIILLCFIALIGSLIFIFYKSEFNAKEADIPELELPLDYFSVNNILYGFGESNNKYKLDSAVLDDGYRSFPTTKITLSPSDYTQNDEYPSESLLKFAEVKNFDVDGDGKFEKVLYLCGIGGNHCPQQVMIIKGSTVIFSVSAGLVALNLTRSDTGNGFFVHWTNDQLVPGGLCCNIGYIKTRFVYENQIFKPVYEQEIRYFQVKNKMN